MHLLACRRCAHSFHGTARCGVRLNSVPTADGRHVFYCVCESPKKQTNWVVLVGALLAIYGALYAVAFLVETAVALWRF